MFIIPSIYFFFFFPSRACESVRASFERFSVVEFIIILLIVCFAEHFALHKCFIKVYIECGRIWDRGMKATSNICSSSHASSICFQWKLRSRACLNSQLLYHFTNNIVKLGKKMIKAAKERGNLCGN